MIIVALFGIALRIHDTGMIQEGGRADCYADHRDV